MSYPIVDFKREHKDQYHDIEVFLRAKVITTLEQAHVDPLSLIKGLANAGAKIDDHNDAAEELFTAARESFPTNVLYVEMKLLLIRLITESVTRPRT